MAAAVDLERLKLARPPVPVLEATDGTFGWFKLRGGTLLYQSAGQGGGSLPVLVNRAGVRRSLPGLPERQSYGFPAVSPDGRKIAMRMLPAGGTPSQMDIWMYELPAGPLTRLTFDGRDDDPSWTPDGTRILFDSDREGGNALWMVPWDGTASPQMHAPPYPDRKPHDDEMDIFGVTHPGKVRSENQDQFLVCSLRKEAVVHQTSLPGTSKLTAGSERVALLMMVADGVGGGQKGAKASRIALEAVTRYVSDCMACYYAATTGDDSEFFDALQDGALQSHAEILRRAEESPDYRGMATTLTLYLGHWPRAYLLQVGDSRCYLLRGADLMQISRDQTMAQELIDMGVMRPAEVAGTRLERTLSSSIGGRQTAPVVTRFELTWDTVVLLCSDGLTRQVSDDRIAERLRETKSSRDACGALLQDALAGGGSDNITAVVRRTVPSH